jgi:hypothetical protein
MYCKSSNGKTFTESETFYIQEVPAVTLAAWGKLKLPPETEKGYGIFTGNDYIMAVFPTEAEAVEEFDDVIKAVINGAQYYTF